MQLLLELNLAQDPRNWGSLSPSDRFRQAAFNNETPYVELYRIGLSGKDYNILLTDFSYIQFYGIGDETDFRVRYAFYPNPYVSSSFGEFETDGKDADDVEGYMQLASESIEVNRRPIVRYEVARSDYRHLRHPASHIHLGLDPQIRLPVDKALTPLAFTFVIARFFYSEAWHNAGDEAETEFAGLEARCAQSRQDCELLGDNLFSAYERQQFHFS